MEVKTKRMSTGTMVLGAILTALIVVLQLMGAFIRFGPFSISLVLVPIVIGAATCGTGMGAWLGLVFGAAVLMSGDAGAFLAVNIIGTVITVLVKGIACGYFAGLIYKCLEKYNSYAATIGAAIVCPIVNTGVFLIGCLLFFMETVTGWATAAGLGGGVAHYMIFGLVGANFLFELGINIILSPIIVRLLKIRKGSK